MDNEITIRKISGADLTTLQSISRETFYDAFAWANSETDMNIYAQTAFSAEQLLGELNNPESEFYFALEASKTIGYLKLNTGQAQSDLHTENNLELARIYVQKQFQGHHIGQKLLDKTIEVARKKKADYVWLGVWEKNPGAIRFYERNGFVKFSTHPFMLGNDRQTDILMKLMLKY